MIYVYHQHSYFCHSDLQVEDTELRLKFLRAAEALSLLMGLLGDAGLKAARWNDATRALLARPLDPQVMRGGIHIIAL